MKNFWNNWNKLFDNPFSPQAYFHKTKNPEEIDQVKVEKIAKVISKSISGTEQGWGLYIKHAKAAIIGLQATLPIPIYEKTFDYRRGDIVDFYENKDEHNEGEWIVVGNMFENYVPCARVKGKSF